MKVRGTSDSGTHPRSNARGVTLLELLIVLAVLAALMAIALPFTLRSLEARELESTEENIASELIKARVKAQESGRPVEVVVVEEPPRVIVRYFREDDSGAAPPDEPNRSGAGNVSFRPRFADATFESWGEESALHPSVSVATMPTANERPDGQDRVDGQHRSPHGGNPVRLAVYLPDGTTLFAATLLLMHQNGLSSRVSVDPWTGQPAIRRGNGSASASAATETPSDDGPDADEGFGDPASEDGDISEFEFSNRPEDDSGYESGR
jgi:prepilin-type N-terminal cleavage/methylation domain-containing protein